MINLKQIPHSSGVYYFISNNEIIYIGSSKNLYHRMCEHNYSIKKGSEHGRQIDFYQFLQSNQFEVQYQLTEDYKQLEQELIEKHQPKYNRHRALTGIGAYKGNEIEYNKEYYKKYKNQLCNYNGVVLTLNALQARFVRSGIEHPVLEAKKFLINKDNI